MGNVVKWSFYDLHIFKYGKPELNGYVKLIGGSVSN